MITEKERAMWLENVKTVFVDLDDTIWWTAENSKVAMRQLFAKAGLSRLCAYEDFYAIYMAKNDELWTLYHHGEISKDFLVSERFRYTLERVGQGGDLLAASLELNERYLELLGRQRLLLPGARELLEHLNGRYDVNVLSNGFKSVQRRKLESAGVAHLVHRLILSDDCGVTKPMRGIFDYALRECGCSADTTVMIGDNYDADIIGAHEAGWRTIFFNLRGAKLGRTVADFEVANLADILWNQIL